MRTAIAVALLATAGCYGARGLGGAEGFSLALVGSGLNLGAWWVVVGTLGRASRENVPPRLGSMLVVLAFLLKLPVFVALGFLARKLGPSAWGCFIFGVVLVYFAVPTWAALRARVF